MDKRLILAKAGAGKTYYLCNALDSTKRNLIIAFTNENVHNIENELIKRFGKIPDKTVVTTFHKFLYNNGVKPFEPSILKGLRDVTSTPDGLTIQSPPQKGFTKNKKWIPTPDFIESPYFGHYVHKSGSYYCSTISELLCISKRKQLPMSHSIAERIKLLFDWVFIDEFQDFREYDFQILIDILQNLENILLVGDYYQHSVSGKNNTGLPFKEGQTNVSYSRYKQRISDYGITIDETSLVKSRRCTATVCTFIRNKLLIDIFSANPCPGDLIWPDVPQTVKLLQDPSIIKLVYRDAKKQNFNAINWSYSKGNTYDRVCVILTRNLDGLNSDNFQLGKLSPTTLNKLYVALTRSKGDVFIIPQPIFKAAEKELTSLVNSTSITSK